MKSLTSFAVALSMACVLAFPTQAEDTFITDDMVDLDTIIEDEQLGDRIQLQRGYLFLAVLDGGVYKTFIAGTLEDEDGDGSSVIEEPNDLSEYQELGEISNTLSIPESVHICYISTLPGYADLFPGSDDPVEMEGGVIDITTEETDANTTRSLVGTKSFPIMDLFGNSSGVEHFTAFYNTSGEDNATVTSFGFIALNFSE